MNTQEFLNDYDERVIALAQHLDLNLEPDFDEDDTYYVANRDDYDTDEEFQQEQDDLNKEKEEAREEAIREVTDELDSIVENSGNVFDYYGQEYYVLTDDEADDMVDRRLDDYLEELVYPEIPEHLRGYFDDEAWKEDAKTDGRGHAISRYDGNEYEETVNGTTYFIYRID